MSKNPHDLKFTQSHEWLRAHGGEATIGITHYAQEALGDIVFVELPEVGASFKAGQSFGVVESVKTTSELYAPVDCEVVAVNADLVNTPEVLNADPFGEGWLIRVKVTDKGALSSLLDAGAYDEHLASGGHH